MTEPQAETIGVLVMAYGGPDSLADIEPYLLDIRGGRPTSQELIAEIAHRYAQIGGKSPLLAVTRRQAADLEAALNRSGAGRFRTYVGMRHWQPRIAAAVAQMQADGVRQAVGIVMAPHYSRMSIGAYVKKTDEALAELEAGIAVTHVESWHTHPLFLQAIAEQIQAALGKFGPEEPPFVLFTAHSLPVRILRDGDPYDAQLQETARALAERLALPDEGWQFCYQSAGATGEPWLGPQIEEVIPKLAGAGRRAVLVVPIGFVADHVEVLYDIDIEARDIAAAHGLHLERTASLNNTPTFIAALADIVLATVRERVGAR